MQPFLYVFVPGSYEGLWGRIKSRFPIALADNAIGNRLFLLSLSQIRRAPISVGLTHLHALHSSSYGLIESIICLLERHVCVPRMSEVLICRHEPHGVQCSLLPSSHPSFSEDRSYPQTAPVNIRGLDILIIEEYKYTLPSTQSRSGHKTDVLYMKGQILICLLRRPRSFGVWRTLLKTDHGGSSCLFHHGLLWQLRDGQDETQQSQADINHGQLLSPPTWDCGGLKLL